MTIKEGRMSVYNLIHILIILKVREKKYIHSQASIITQYVYRRMYGYSIEVNNEQL
jgi:hypothetical protein